VFARVGHNQPLAEKFVCALDSGCQHRMTLRGVAADAQDECKAATPNVDSSTYLTSSLLRTSL
jgi:hypothetical protein